MAWGPTVACASYSLGAEKAFFVLKWLKKQSEKSYRFVTHENDLKFKSSLSGTEPRPFLRWSLAVLSRTGGGEWL